MMTSLTYLHVEIYILCSVTYVFYVLLHMYSMFRYICILCSATLYSMFRYIFSRLLMGSCILLSCNLLHKHCFLRDLKSANVDFSPQEIEYRQTARAEGRRYCDPVAQRFQMEMIPEPIRLKIGSAGQQQMSVYQEFARHVPGFTSASANSNFSDLLGQQNSTHNKQHNVSVLKQ